MMLKKVAVLILMSTLVAGVAEARHHGGFVGDKNMPAMQGGGFQGPRLDLSTVSQALKMKDDSYVYLKGNIVKRLKSDKYLFQDSTGSVEVEIDDKRWMGQIVTPADTVEIYGKLDKELIGSTEIEVKRIELVK